MTTVDAQPLAESHISSLTRRLGDRGYRFDFFQAVWLLERLHGRTPIGERGPAAAETLRFRPTVSVGFPGADLHGIRAYDDESGAAKFLVETTFLGVYGVDTPLPVHYAFDVARESARAIGSEDAAGMHASAPVRDFLDLFHNRVAALLYRAWLKYRYDRAFGSKRDVLSAYLRLLMGGGPEIGEAEHGLDPVRLLRYIAAFTQRPRSAMLLEGVLRDYFAPIPFRVRQFRGQWVTLAERDLNRLGLANCGVGEDMTVGEQIYDLSGAFTIEVGPVDWPQYLTFTIGAERFNAVRALSKLLCQDPLTFTFETTLAPGAARPTQLVVDDERAAKLGLTAWVASEPLGEQQVTAEAHADDMRPHISEPPQPPQPDAPVRRRSVSLADILASE